MVLRFFEIRFVQNRQSINNILSILLFENILDSIASV